MLVEDPNDLPVPDDCDLDIYVTTLPHQRAVELMVIESWDDDETPSGKRVYLDKGRVTIRDGYDWNDDVIPQLAEALRAYADYLDEPAD